MHNFIYIKEKDHSTINIFFIKTILGERIKNIISYLFNLSRIINKLVRFTRFKTRFSNNLISLFHDTHKNKTASNSWFKYSLL